MIKDKMQRFQLNSHLEDYADIDMNNIRTIYNTAKDHVDSIKQDLNSQMDKFYDIFIRRDPARPLYNY